MSSNIDTQLTKTIKTYLESVEEISNEKSWYYCHRAFHKDLGRDTDYLALQLTAYLASWGMYRGSSGLPKTNYKVHEGAVEIILHYRDKLYAEPEDSFITDESIQNLMALKTALEQYYRGIEIHWEKGKKPISPTETLISKIILGSLGCVPAYDTYFLLGIKGFDIEPSFSESSIKSIHKFIVVHSSELKDFITKEPHYTPMKLVDMYFFQRGIQAERARRII